MSPLALPERPRILVVALRRLGDVLFATPLIAAIRAAWPQASIDALVFDDTAGILAGNPDLDGIVVMPARRTALQGLALALKLARRYDLAISTQSGDRPTAFALIAGRHRVGPIDRGMRGALRQLLLTRSVVAEPGRHRLEEMHRLADVLGIARVGHLVCPRAASPSPRSRGEGRGEGLSLPAQTRGEAPSPAPSLPSPASGGGRGGRDLSPHAARGESTAQWKGANPYAVVHAAPNFVYKRWTRDGWRALAAGLGDRGLKIVATGGPAADERALLDGVWDGCDVMRLDGQLSWPQTAALIAGARVYVGPDTSVTHLAAASGCPTVALYGPTDPRLWGPVPAGGLDPMWEARGTIQQRGNVWLVQNPQPCQPCHQEGCDRHIASHSRCLDELTSAQVLRAVDAALASQAPDSAPTGLGTPSRLRFPHEH
jgi:heptosyltransferase-3